MRESGICRGRKSFNQNAFDFGCVQVVVESPPRPCTATILGEAKVSEGDPEMAGRGQRIFKWDLLDRRRPGLLLTRQRAARAESWIVKSKQAVYLFDIVQYRSESLHQ